MEQSEVAPSILDVKLAELAEAEHFNELLKLACDTCLTEPLPVAATPRPLDNLTAQVGLWGLRAALDTEKFGYMFSHESPGRAQFEELMRVPETMPTYPDRQVQGQIESFGLGMINEAFACLGEDASDYVQKWRSATTHAEYGAVLEWLFNRIDTITNDANDSSEFDIVEDTQPQDGPEWRLVDVPSSDLNVNDMSQLTSQITESTRSATVLYLGEDANEVINGSRSDFYHPARLSPKIIGVYPDIHVMPTCLGVSILSASFFERAGAEYMHAGIMSMAQQEGHQASVLITDLIKQASEDLDIRLPDPVQNVFDCVGIDASAAASSHRGYHAALLIKVPGTGWLEFDPNYKSVSYLQRGDSQELDTMASTLNMATGVECTYRSSSYTFIYSMAGVIEKARSGNHVLPNPEQSLTDVLTSRRPKEVLRDYVIHILTAYEMINGLVDIMVSNAPSVHGDKMQYVDRLTSRMIRYLFADDADMEHATEPFKKASARCESDPEYMRRRIEDMKLLPYVTAMAVHQDIVNELIASGDNLGLPAVYYEVGSPHYRVGAAVLSDLAQYTGDDLPASFWWRHWPSVITTVAHGNMSADMHGASWRLKALHVVNSGTLKYMGTSGIISKLLKQQEGSSGNGQKDHKQG